MSPKWTDEGENLVAEIMFKTDNVPPTYYVGLYRDGSEPADDITLEEITEIVDYGYARQELTKDTNWAVSDSIATGDEVTFTSTGNWGKVYGYFICDVASGTTGKMLAVEHFSNGPFNIVTSGSILVIPRVIVS